MLPRQPDGPRLVEPQQPPKPLDARVSAVLEVLAGQTVREVAQNHAVDIALVHRWVHDFIDAGSAQVTNTPRPGDAQQRDRFLAAFAHELRTPLAVAEGWALLLEDDEVPASMAQDAAHKLSAALERLGSTIQDVELLAAASLGRLRIARTPIAVREVARDIPTPVRMTGLPSHTVLDVDADMFTRIVRDLWNAARLGSPPESVHLDLQYTGADVKVSIVRRGLPIDHNILRALFNPFDINDDATGVTIGLYLARALTVAHAGTLGVDQDHTTTTFWVQVPRVSATGQASTSSEGL